MQTYMQNVYYSLYTLHNNIIFVHSDAMNTQVHETTGRSPYELVFGQKPRSVLFPVSTATGVILEEDLTNDGLHFDTGTSAFEMPAEQIDAEDVEDCNQDMDVNLV